jgi:hypothetical protein
MAQLLPLRLLLAAAGFLAAGEAALAQSAACQRYQAELASLPRGGGRQAAAAADRYRAEAARLGQYYRSIGCDRPQFGFFASPPAECGSIAQRMRQMEASAGQVADQAESVQIEGRRRWLHSAIDQACNAAPERARSAEAPSTPRRQEAKADSDDGDKATGGRRTVCVRACDGYYFPLSNAPSGRESEDSMCRALCPGAETAAYTMPGGDDGLDNAVSLKGKPYAQLANAFKFRKAFDPSCSCKKSGQSWAVALREAEKMLDRRRGDIIVTAQKAEELSRPKITTAQLKLRDRKAVETKIDDDAEAQAAAAAGAAAPTAGGESAGIGPRTIVSNRTIPRTEGEKHQLVAADGSKRVVRVIGAGVIPLPDTVSEQIVASRQAAAAQQTAANQAPAPTDDGVTTGSIGPARR